MHPEGSRTFGLGKVPVCILELWKPDGRAKGKPKEQFLGGDSRLKYVEQLEGCRGFQREGRDADGNGSRRRGRVALVLTGRAVSRGGTLFVSDL